MTRPIVQAIRHISFEDLGSFEAPLRAAGFDIEYVDVAERDPSSLDPMMPDLLVVLGGPIGVYDHDAYPVVSSEIQLLRTRLAANRPTLGICLGARSTPIHSPCCAGFQCFTGMAIPSICRRAARDLRRHRFAQTRLFPSVRTSLVCSFTRKCWGQGSSTGCSATPTSWQQPVLTPSCFAAMQRDMPAISKRPAPRC